MKLAQWRIAKNITQATLADRLGVKPAAVSRYESGVRLPCPIVMARIYRVTRGKVRPADFYNLSLEAAE